MDWGLPFWMLLFGDPFSFAFLFLSFRNTSEYGLSQLGSAPNNLSKRSYLQQKMRENLLSKIKSTVNSAFTGALQKLQ